MIFDVIKALKSSVKRCITAEKRCGTRRLVWRKSVEKCGDKCGDVHLSPHTPPHLLCTFLCQAPFMSINHTVMIRVDRLFQQGCEVMCVIQSIAIYNILTSNVASAIFSISSFGRGRPDRWNVEEAGLHRKIGTSRHATRSQTRPHFIANVSSEHSRGAKINKRLSIPPL